MQIGSEATVFLQRAESSWLRLNGSVRVSVDHAENAGVAGVAIKLDPANQDVKVPKRVRELWIGAAALVKCNQVNNNEIRFALPENNKGNAAAGQLSGSIGYMGCAVKFEVEKELRKFQGLASSLGILIENKSNTVQKTQPTKERTSSASRSLAAAQAPTASTSKKRSAVDVSQALDSQSSSPPESFGGDRRKPRIERASQGESDSEPETEPENDWDGKLVDSRGLSLDAVKGSEAAAEAKKQTNTPLPVEELDLNDKKTQSYIQHLYKDENFRQFTNDLEELVRKEPRIPGGSSAADPIMGFLG